jgi:hypothetical protein
MITSAAKASRQLSVNNTTIANLQQPGGRIDVAGEPRQDAAGLHAPKFRERQVHEPVEERAAEREHHAHIEQALAVVLPRPQQVRKDDDREKQGAGQLQTGEAGAGVEPGVEQDAVDDEAHEQRLNHLQRCRHEGQNKDRDDASAMRPEPAQVVAEIFAARAPAGRFLRFARRRVSGLGGGVPS